MRTSTLFVLLALSSTATLAQVRTGSTVEASTQTQASTKAVSELDATDRVVQEIWGLTAEEMRRAKVLAQGPRRNFSVPNLSPLEILGIHARTDAERRQYAERFAKIFRADVERSIAWDRAYSEAMAKLYPNDPMISFDGLPKVLENTACAEEGLGAPGFGGFILSCQSGKWKKSGGSGGAITDMCQWGTYGSISDSQCEVMCGGTAAGRWRVLSHWDMDSGGGGGLRSVTTPGYGIQAAGSGQAVLCVKIDN